MKTEVKIKGYHLDFLGRVGNQKLLEFLDEARWMYFEQIGIDSNILAKKGAFFVLVHIDANFRAPALLGDQLIIETDILKIGNRSLTIRQRIFNKKNNLIICDSESVYSMVDVLTGRSIIIGNDIKELWSKNLEKL